MMLRSPRSGQSLRGDSLLNGYDPKRIIGLAGQQADLWRQEFVKMVGVADTLEGG